MGFYASELSDSSLRLRAAFEDAWLALCGTAPGEAWVLSPCDYLRVAALKPLLRASWVPHLVKIVGRVLKLRQFHLPDPDGIGVTWTRVNEARNVLHGR